MDSQSLAYIPHNSNKRVFPGGSSSCMDPDVVEISPPPINGSSNSRSRSRSRSLKQKEVIQHEVIDVDLDDDCGEVLLLGAKAADKTSKGKEAMVNFSSELGNAIEVGSMDGTDSLDKSSTIGLDSLSLDLSNNDDYMDIYCDDFVFDDDYSIMQSHFDNINIPSGIEAPIPWLPGPLKNASTPPATEPAQSSIESISTSLSKNELMLPHQGFLSGPKIFNNCESSHFNWNPVVPTSSSDAHDPFGNTQMFPLPQHIGASKYSNRKRTKVFSSAGIYSSFNHPMSSPFSSHFLDHPPPGVVIPPHYKHMYNQSLGNGAPPYPGLAKAFSHGPFGPTQMTTNSWQPPAAVSSSNFHKYGNEEEIQKKFQVFKKFDTVEDYSDHHYVNSINTVKQPPKNWAKKIQDEWKILEKDLPDTIFVRVYESRMDLLRAVIVGAEGTPYHDGLFFFDVHFPSSYPNVPPHVYYHSGGLRINPNLYNQGKVCLSLLNTWSGGKQEKWLPGKSTMLQVLVSIQGLILTSKPYFNEPGYESSSGSPAGEKAALQYNEDTLIKSLTTMVYSIRRPPKHFEDLVAGHFLTRAHDILVACKAYMDGAQVGCLVRGGVQDVDEGDKSCSQAFKNNVSAHIAMLVEAFKQVGAKDCDKFLSPPQTR